MRLFISILLLSLTACGSDDSPAVPVKELFSVWTQTADPTVVLDLSAGSFGIAQTYSGVYPTGEICDCQLALLGTQTSGTFTMSACTYRAATGGGADPGCAAALNGNGTYTNSAAVLTICDNGGGCEPYR